MYGYFLVLENGGSSNLKLASKLRSGMLGLLQKRKMLVCYRVER